eukprot:1161469-Pelagomonas_calceolata.AAC.32
MARLGAEHHLQFPGCKETMQEGNHTGDAGVLAAATAAPRQQGLQAAGCHAGASALGFKLEHWFYLKG